MSCEELEIVWNNIKAEARTLADCEPMLASFYHATLLKHENLGSAGEQAVIANYACYCYP